MILEISKLTESYINFIFNPITIVVSLIILVIDFWIRKYKER